MQRPGAWNKIKSKSSGFSNTPGVPSQKKARKKPAGGQGKKRGK